MPAPRATTSVPHPMFVAAGILKFGLPAPGGWDLLLDWLAGLGYDASKEEVRAIWKAERTRVASLGRKMDREELRAIAGNALGLIDDEVDDNDAGPAEKTVEAGAQVVLATADAAVQTDPVVTAAALPDVSAHGLVLAFVMGLSAWSILRVTGVVSAHDFAQGGILCLVILGLLCAAIMFMFE